MIPIPLRSIVSRRNQACLHEQEREQVVQIGEVLRLVRAFDRDQRHAHRRLSVIVPEPEQIGALHRFGHGLFHLLQPGDGARRQEAGDSTLWSLISCLWSLVSSLWVVLDRLE